MRNEDRTSDDPQNQRRNVSGSVSHGALWHLAPVTLFVSAYLATFAILSPITPPPRYWVALISATAATLITIRVIEHGQWHIGFMVLPRYVAVDFVIGVILAAVVIGSADLLITISTQLRHTRGDGFPWRELVVVYLPAAVHEEVVFRGYLFQKLRRWNRKASIAISSAVFAALHTGNLGVTPLATINLFVAGLLLALAWERYQRLWFPIGIHLAWNVISGPVLGYDVSGYPGERSMFRWTAGGPGWLTGGRFGIEASIWMLIVELAVLFGLAHANSRYRMRPAE